MSNGALPTSLDSERVERLLAHLWERQGTDLLLTVGAPPLVRVDGELFAVPGEETLTPADTEQLVHSLLTDENLDVFRREHEFDFAFNWQEHARMRGNVFLQRGSWAWPCG